MATKRKHESRVSRGGEGVIRRVTPEQQRAMAIQGLEERRYDVQTQRGWDLAHEELRPRITELEARLLEVTEQRDRAQAIVDAGFNERSVVAREYHMKVITALVAERDQKAGAERERAERSEAALRALVSDHDGLPAVWVCEQCGQPLGKGGRCNSSLHVPPGAHPNGAAIATTDLVAELGQARAALRFIADHDPDEPPGASYEELQAVARAVLGDPPTTGKEQ